VIGHIQHPLVNQGDAVVHIADVGDDLEPSRNTGWGNAVHEGHEEV
jgi:hypothetical protein